MACKKQTQAKQLAKRSNKSKNIVSRLFMCGSIVASVATPLTNVTAQEIEPTVQTTEQNKISNSQASQSTELLSENTSLQLDDHQTDSPEGLSVDTVNNILEEEKILEAYGADESVEVLQSGTIGTCSWEITSDGVLSISDGKLPASLNSSTWLTYQDLITKIRFTGAVIAGSYINNLFDGLSNVTTIENLNYLDTSKTTRMMYVFRNCSSLQQVDLSAWDTSKVVTFTAMFDGCASITDLDLSTFDTSNTKSYYMMFNDCPSLTTLDISSFGKNGTTAAYSMFDSTNTNIKSITLGEHTPFNASSNKLPEHEAAGSMTKGWIGINSKQFYPNTAKFTQLYDGSSPDTYVWAAHSVVKYVDTEGKIIHEDKHIYGYLGGEYDATSADFQLELAGYHLDTAKIPENVTGIFNEELQTITYVYVKDPILGEDVTIRYVDTNHNEIHEPQTISGYIGNTFDASTEEYQLAIDSYTLDKSRYPYNVFGVFSDVGQTVTFVYEKDPIQAKDVIVRYVDTEQNEIHEPQTISGYIGNAYDASTKEYQLAIEGYTLDTTQLPYNVSGFFTDFEQTVTFIYIKELENPEEPNTPEEPEQPEEPGTPEEPEQPEEPGTPEEPEQPEEPNTPEEPELPEEPGAPEEPEQPEEPGTPEEPGLPEEPGTPEEPGLPEEPNTPEEPELPEEPGTPEEPEQPEEPGTPEEPEQPEEPGTPEEPEQPEQPEEPNTPEEPEQPEEPGMPEKSGTLGDYKKPEILTNQENTEKNSDTQGIKPAKKTSDILKFTEEVQDQSHLVNKKSGQLPKTGESTNTKLTLVGLGTFTLALMAWLFRYKTNKKDKA